jgi:hypothetical protein
VAINTTIIRLGRAIGMTAVIVAASGMLQTTGQPLFVVVGDVALNLAAIQSEAEKLRRKTSLLRLGRIIQQELESRPRLLATEAPRTGIVN